MACNLPRNGAGAGARVADDDLLMHRPHQSI
jgi:hypothetical protein